MGGFSGLESISIVYGFQARSICLDVPMTKQAMTEALLRDDPEEQHAGRLRQVCC